MTEALHDAPPRAALLAPPWDTLDDAALLARLRGPRPVRLDLVVDADECTPARLQGVLDGRFEFNGESHRLGARPDWLHNPSSDREWHILLHKFYYAPGLAQAFRASGEPRWARRFVELADSWIDQVEPGFIASDVTGRRVQNWIYALRGFVFRDGADEAAPPALPPGFVRRLLVSLHQQVEHLCAHLTPQRNHRTLELYAIFLAGVALPEFARAAHWRRFALQETAANLCADLLPDGVHCELSTDYHHLALRNWLHVRTLAVRHGETLPPGVDRLLERALEFSLHVHAPDGVVPALSDGDARSFLPLLAQGADLFGREDFRWVATRGAAGRAPTRTFAHFASSGYAVLRSGWGSGPHDFGDAQHLVFDAGPLGEGNHGHLDALSLTLHAHGRALLVDPGRYTYSEAGTPNWRVHFRGTAAHNTVCVDGRQQTAYRPRPARRDGESPRHKIAGPAPEVRWLEGATAPGLALLRARAASHEYDARHERSVVGIDGALWIVVDRLRAPTAHEYALHFQLHPRAQGRCTLRVDDALRVDSPGLRLLQPLQSAQQTQLEEGWVSERYGHKAPAPRLRCVQRGHDVDFHTVLLPWGAAAPAARVALCHGDGGTRWLEVLHTLPGQPTRDLWWQATDDDTELLRLHDLSFHGRWLHLRRRADGALLAATSHLGARLVDPTGHDVPLAVACTAPPP